MPHAAKSSRVRRLPGKPPQRPAPKPHVAAPWSLRKAGGLRVLELAPWKKFSWLAHGFSTRPGGASVLPSGERVLNLGFMEWDKHESVQRNRAAFQAAIGGAKAQLVPLKQIHSGIVQFFSGTPGEPCRGDASISDAAGLLLAVQTADCVPILLLDPKKRAVAAVHAGWRGTLARILEKTVGEMRVRFGSRPADLQAAIGPSIGACCYEVGTELVTEFSSQFDGAEDFFDELRTGEEPNPLQWLNMMPPGHQPPPKNVRLDLRKANRAQLLAAGLRDANIFASELCTACHPSLLFSYRKEGPVSGRLMAAIGIIPSQK